MKCYSAVVWTKFELQRRICTTGSYELPKIYMPNKSFSSNTTATIIFNVFVPKFYLTSTNHSVELVDSLRYFCTLVKKMIWWKPFDPGRLLNSSLLLNDLRSLWITLDLIHSEFLSVWWPNFLISKAWYPIGNWHVCRHC